MMIHSWSTGDPDITITRKLAVELLERMEMARDHVEHATGKSDAWARRVIGELEEKLK